MKGFPLVLIYVAGPYRAKDRKGVEKNIQAARKIAAELWTLGHAVHCPHTNTAHFDQDFSHIPDEAYLEGDLRIVERCDALVVVPNWEHSEGTRGEILHAANLGIPVYYYPDVPPLHPTEVRCPEQAKAFSQTIGRMYRTHLSKNHDYSPANMLVTGEVGMVTRLWDKIARLLNLYGFQFEASMGKLHPPKDPKHEPIDDTLLDAAVYSVIGLLMRRGKWGK